MLSADTTKRAAVLVAWLRGGPERPHAKIVRTTRASSEILVAYPPNALAVTAEGAAALRVRFLWTACLACWLLGVSQLPSGNYTRSSLGDIRSRSSSSLLAHLVMVEDPQPVLRSA